MAKADAIEAYRKALRVWADAVSRANEVAEDAYKAPELNVLETYAVMSAAHNLQIAYAVMNAVGTDG